MKVSLGSLVSYDFEYLKTSLPQVYNYVDAIVLAIDSKRQTLTGNKYDFDESFYEWIKAFDKSGKIIWVEESFYKPGLTPFDVIMKKRRAMLKAMPSADWYIQMDADEYFVDFPAFRQFLFNTHHNNEPVMVTTPFKTMFKTTPNGFLMIQGNLEIIPMAFSVPEISSERNLDIAKRIDSPCQVLHQSWARPDAEIKHKIENWSHSHDFDTGTFFKFWLQLNSKNYKYKRNFHPLYAPTWPALEMISGTSVEALIQYYRIEPAINKPLPRLPMWVRAANKVGRLLIKRNII